MYYCLKVSNEYRSTSVEQKRHLIKAVRKYPKVWNIDVDDDEVEEEWNNLAAKEMGDSSLSNACKSMWESIRMIYFREIFTRTIERKFEVPPWAYFHDMAFMYEFVKEDIQKNLGGISPPLFRVFYDPEKTDSLMVQCPCCIYIKSKPTKETEQPEIKVNKYKCPDKVNQQSSPKPQHTSLDTDMDVKEVLARQLPCYMKIMKLEQRKLYQQNLIREVNFRPVIYDNSVHTKKIRTLQAWREISKAMGNVEVRILKSSWNWIKSQYLKELIAEIQYPSDKKHESTNLDFMRPFLEKHVQEVCALRLAIDTTVKNRISDPKCHIDLNTSFSTRTYCKKPKDRQQTDTLNSQALSILQNRPLKVKILHPNDNSICENIANKTNEEGTPPCKRICLSLSSGPSNTAPAIETKNLVTEPFVQISSQNQVSSIKTTNLYSNKTKAESLRVALGKAIGIPEVCQSEKTIEKSPVTPVILKQYVTPILNQVRPATITPPVVRPALKKILPGVMVNETLAPNLSINQSSTEDAHLQVGKTYSLSNQTLKFFQNRSSNITSKGPSLSAHPTVMITDPNLNAEKINAQTTSEKIQLDPKTLAFLQKQSIVITPMTVGSSESKRRAEPVKSDVEISTILELNEMSSFEDHQKSSYESKPKAQPPKSVVQITGTGATSSVELKELPSFQGLRTYADDSKRKAQPPKTTFQITRTCAPSSIELKDLPSIHGHRIHADDPKRKAQPSKTTFQITGTDSTPKAQPVKVFQIIRTGATPSVELKNQPSVQSKLTSTAKPPVLSNKAYSHVFPILDLTTDED